MKKNIIILALINLNGIIFAQEKKIDTISQREIKEVVITSSYGTKKLKEEVVGAISSVNMKEINENQPFESIDKILQGAAAGVEITNNTELAKPISIHIRGLGSIISLNDLQGTSTQPIIIIDGVMMREDNAFNATGFNGNSLSESLINPLARISTDNIESINILKDAAAVALYGADAANGVIIITTKKGRRGKMRVSYLSQYGISQSINKIKYLSGEEYAKVYDAYLKNTTGRNFNWNGKNIDWFETMNQNGNFFKTNVHINGGNQYFTYRFGVNYSKNEESKILNYLQKKGIDASIGFKYKNLSINLYAAYDELIKNQPNTYFNFILAPTFDIYNPDGSYALTGQVGIANPLAAAHQNINKLYNYSFLSSLNLNYQINKNLKISSIFGLDSSDKEQILWFSGLNDSGRRNGQFQINGINYPRYGRSHLNYSDGKKWNWSIHSQYEKTFFNEHFFDFLLGAEIRSTQDFKTKHEGNNFINPYEYQRPEQAAKYLSNGTEIYGYTYRQLSLKDTGRSLFAQANYNWKKKYFLLATLRRDESSTMGADVRAAYNGAIGLSWIISNENFLKNNDWISFLRLRGSWGMTGNSRIGSFRALGLYTRFENGMIYQYPYAYPDSSSPPVAQLSWEKNEKFNIGLDFNIANKLEINIDAYKNFISDIITSRDVAWETGYTSAEINAAAMYNQGIDFSAKIKWLNEKKLKWNTQFNIAMVRNKVTNLLGLGEKHSISELARAQKIGSPTSAIWGYEWLGVNPETGKDQYLVNGQILDRGQFNATTPTQYTIIGNTQPDAIGGLNNQIFYKNFSLNFSFSFQIGGDILVSPNLIDKYNIMINRNLSVNALDFWTQKGDKTQNAAPDRTSPINNSSKYVYDHTHIKLRNIGLNYQIPIEKSNWVKNASIFIDCSNVFYWYKEKSPQGKNGIRELKYPYPESRTFSFGFRVDF